MQEPSSPFATHGVLIGSGFFVAPTVIVTCQHVLAKAFFVDSPSSSPHVIASLGGEAFRIRKTDVIGFDKVLDLALVSLTDAASFDADVFKLATKTPASSHKCILRGYAPSDSLIQGCSARGIDRGKRWYLDICETALEYPCSVIKVTHGLRTDVWCKVEVRTREGMSGAPLIDMETGQVIGVHAMGTSPPSPWTKAEGIDLMTVAVAAEHVAVLLEQSAYRSAT